MKRQTQICFFTGFIYLLGSLSALLLSFGQTLGQSADIILINGKIFTSDTSQLYVEALAITGNRILARGTTRDIEKLASGKTKKIDLSGKIVVPGFNDGHDHLGWRAPVGKAFRTEFSVSGPSKQAVLDSVTRLVKTAKPDQWISGDIGLSVFNDAGMRKSLDSLTPNHPVALQIMWGHGMVLNGKALQLLGIKKTAPDPLGGRYGRKPGTDTITGVLYEYAQWPVWQTIAMSEPEKLIEGLRAYAQQQVQWGITTVQDMSCIIPAAALSQIYQKAQLPLRIRLISFPGTTSQGRNLAEWKKLPGVPAPLTYVSGVKYLIDGTTLDGTALLKKPYLHKPGWYGSLDMPVDTIRQILQEAITSNTQLLMHIVGDSALAVVLPLMKSLASDAVWKTKRIRIEHNATSKSTALEQQYIREMGLIMAHTPQYGHNSPLRSFLERGIRVAMAPDGLTNPFVNIAIVTSQQKNPSENITRQQAVIMYTLNTAHAEFKEKEKGLLKPGMVADLAVLSQDIFSVPIAELPKTTSLLTMVDGKIVHQHNSVTFLIRKRKKP